MSAILNKTIGGTDYSFESKHYSLLFSSLVVRGSGLGGVMVYNGNESYHIPTLEFVMAFSYLETKDERFLEELLSAGMPRSFLSTPQK